MLVSLSIDLFVGLTTPEECGLAIPQVPCLFVKTANSIGNPNGQLNIPKMAQGEAGFVDYEVELATVFSRTFKDISEEDAMSVVLGYVKRLSYGTLVDDR